MSFGAIIHSAMHHGQVRMNMPPYLTMAKRPQKHYNETRGRA